MDNTLQTVHGGAAAASVLVVDDHEDIREPVTVYLNRQGFSAIAAAGAVEMRDVLRQRSVDAIVLDVMLTDGNGLSLCRELTDACGPPVILLTALAAAQERIAGLDAGADDYVVKPFDPAELAARLRSVLRRSARNSPTAIGDRLGFEGWCFDISARRLSDPTGRPVELSEIEYRLLAALAGQAGEVLSREQLLDLTQQGEYYAFDRSVDVQVCRLRKKLGQRAGLPPLIRTVRGGGYLFAGRVVRLP